MVIVGGGNPVFSTTDLQSIVEDIKNLGIKRLPAILSLMPVFSMITSWSGMELGL